jgi:hypothetical protein
VLVEDCRTARNFWRFPCFCDRAFGPCSLYQHSLPARPTMPTRRECPPRSLRFTGANPQSPAQVGRGSLTLAEQRSHFALWALLKSPLLIGADLERLSADSLAILRAREVVAVSQDEVGPTVQL